MADPVAITERKCERCDTIIRHKHGGLCAACLSDDMDSDEPEEMDEDEAFLSYQCGFIPGHGCTLAGTEDCDWECPRGRAA
ncbi:hypothetical protein [Novosphingobium sp.]|uniref:hypothetical protein n=1 Tax=Novosphingobium sp. TaxID=1874826 RepID=UPI00262FE750|nr:hypothetical protein [Novosphingobium sp.]